MTGSRYRLPRPGHRPLMSATSTPATTDRRHPSPPTKCAPTGASVKALRPLRGRATGPSLDPGASHRRAQTAAERDEKKGQQPLTRPRSFRDDLRTAPKFVLVLQR